MAEENPNPVVQAAQSLPSGMKDQIADLVLAATALFTSSKLWGFLSKTGAILADRLDTWAHHFDTLYHTTFVVAARSVLWRFVLMMVASFAAFSALVYYSVCGACDLQFRDRPDFGRWYGWYGVGIFALMLLPQLRYLWRARNVQSVSVESLKALDERYDSPAGTALAVVQTQCRERRVHLTAIAGGRLDLTPGPAFSMAIWGPFLLGLQEIVWAFCLNLAGVHRPWILALLLLGGFTVLLSCLAYLAEMTLFFAVLENVGGFTIRLVNTVYHAAGSLAPVITLKNAKEKLGALSDQVIKDLKGFAFIAPTIPLYFAAMLWAIALVYTNHKIMLIVVVVFIITAICDLFEKKTGLNLTVKMQRRAQRFSLAMMVSAVISFLPMVDELLGHVPSQIAVGCVNILNFFLCPRYAWNLDWYHPMRYAPLMFFALALAALVAAVKYVKGEGSVMGYVRATTLTTMTLSVLVTGLGLILLVSGNARAELIPSDAFAAEVCPVRNTTPAQTPTSDAGQVANRPSSDVITITARAPAPVMNSPVANSANQPDGHGHRSASRSAPRPIRIATNSPVRSAPTMACSQIASEAYRAAMQRRGLCAP